MKRCCYLLFIVLNCNLALQGQTKTISFDYNTELIHEIVLKLDEYDVHEAEILNNKLRDTLFQNLFRFKIDYLKTGEFNYEDFFENDSSESFLQEYSILKKSIYGFYLSKTKIKRDSIIFKIYKEAYENSKHLENQVLINHCLNNICKVLFNNYLERDLFKKYISLYKQSAKNNVDKFWANYFEIANEQLRLYNLRDSSNVQINYDLLNFKKGYRLAENDYLKGVLTQLEGIFNDVILKDYRHAEISFDRAVKTFKTIDYFYAQRRIYGNTVNKGIALFNQKKIAEAIDIFKGSLEEKKLVSLKDKSYIYNWIRKSYDSIGEVDSAYLYNRKLDVVKEELARIKHAISIRETDKQYDLSKKEKELESLTQKNSKLKTNIMTLAPILGFIIVVLILMVYLYKRYKRKSAILEEEQSETLQKLDELKSIVIKNHIVLKDKTKVYISNLMYIKSDDHYLEVFTQDDKSHLVRGKLSQIREELPPNFIQCHRSYIINSNFIKQVGSTSLTLINKEQIPLSRSFKNKFK